MVGGRIGTNSYILRAQRSLRMVTYRPLYHVILFRKHRAAVPNRKAKEKRKCRAAGHVGGPELGRFIRTVVARCEPTRPVVCVCVCREILSTCSSTGERTYLAQGLRRRQRRLRTTMQVGHNINICRPVNGRSRTAEQTEGFVCVLD